MITIKADYVVMSMIYIESLHKILISNNEKIILVDVYTFKSENQLSFSQISSIEPIHGTDYVMITKNYNVVQIFDANKFTIQKTLDNSHSILTGGEK